MIYISLFTSLIASLLSFNLYAAKCDVATLGASGKVIKKIKKKIASLNYESISPGTFSELDSLLYEYGRVKLPTPDMSNNNINVVNVSERHFMQRSINHKSSKKNGGYSVINNALQIQDKKINVVDIPSITVWRDTDGKIWTLNHRRLAAFVMAGIDKVPVVWAEEQLILNRDTKDKYYPYKNSQEVDLVNIKKGWKIRIRIEN